MIQSKETYTISLTVPAIDFSGVLTADYEFKPRTDSKIFDSLDAAVETAKDQIEEITRCQYFIGGKRIVTVWGSSVETDDPRIVLREEF